MNTVRRLYRSRKDRMLGGVCGGMAEYFALDPVLVRVLWIIFGVMGAGILVYLILLLVIPEESFF
jgi:phage shock protein C